MRKGNGTRKNLDMGYATQTNGKRKLGYGCCCSDDSQCADYIDRCDTQERSVGGAMAVPDFTCKCRSWECVSQPFSGIEFPENGLPEGCCFSDRRTTKSV